jgi:hypothetical protein
MAGSSLLGLGPGCIARLVKNEHTFFSGYFQHKNLTCAEEATLLFFPNFPTSESWTENGRS